mmetsp:Transcript_1682/g.3572  ORF Transcript_1682/g.3572 Transcript_1682/m.3572 type:complete len:200 (+) Transcript_1682:2550-3149(+)
MVIKSISRLLSGNDVSSSSGDVPSEVVTKGGDEKTAVTFDDYTQPTFEDFEREADAKIQQHIDDQQKLLKNQDQMKSTLDEINQTTRKTEAKVDVLEEAVKQTPLKVKEMMETMLDTYVKSAVKEIKDAQGGQLKTPAAKKKKRNADSASVAGRPPISTAKKSRPSTLSIPGVEKHTMRQSEDAKKLAFDKRREGRIVT